jgi:hypothetical protein
MQHGSQVSQDSVINDFVLEDRKPASTANHVVEDIPVKCFASSLTPAMPVTPAKRPVGRPFGWRKDKSLTAIKKPKTLKTKTTTTTQHADSEDIPLFFARLKLLANGEHPRTLNHRAMCHTATANYTTRAVAHDTVDERVLRDQAVLISDFKTALERMISKVGLASLSVMFNEVFSSESSKCQKHKCHPGAFRGSEDGWEKCCGTLTFTHNLCIQTLASDTPAFAHLLQYKPGKIKQGVFVHKSRSINSTTAIMKYPGTAMTQAEYELAAPERRAISVKNSHDMWVVPVMHRMLNGSLVVPGENWGGNIAKASGAQKANCVIRTALDGTLIVVANHALNGGDQLLFKKNM